LRYPHCFETNQMRMLSIFFCRFLLRRRLLLNSRKIFVVGPKIHTQSIVPSITCFWRVPITFCSVACYSQQKLQKLIYPCHGKYTGTTKKKTKFIKLARWRKEDYCLVGRTWLNSSGYRRWSKNWLILMIISLIACIDLKIGGLLHGGVPWLQHSQYPPLIRHWYLSILKLLLRSMSHTL